MRRRRAAVHAGVGDGNGAVQAQPSGQAAPRGQFDPGRLDGSRVLTLAQHPAGRNKACAREGSRPLADGHIDDGVLDPVPEQGRAEGRDRPLIGQPCLHALQGLGNQGGVGLGQVVADPERAVQLVQGGGPEAGIGRPPRRPAAADETPRRQSRADHFARAVGIGLVQGRRSIGPIPLQTAAVFILPAVQPQASGHQPQFVAPRRLAIQTSDRGLAARDAVAGEGAVHEAEAFAGLAFVEASVGAHLPFQPSASHIARCAAQRGVDAPAGCGRLILIIGGRGRVAVRRHRDGGIGEIAFASPGLQSPAIVAVLRPLRRRGRQQVTAGAGPRAHQARAALFVIGRGAQRQTGLAQRRVQPQRRRLGGQIQRRVRRPGRRAAYGRIAVAGLIKGRARKAQRAGIEPARTGQPRPAPFGDRGVQHPAAFPLAQLDHPGQGARAIGTGPRATHDIETFQRLGRQLRPQDPAAERIIQRHAVQSHQRPPRP